MIIRNETSVRYWKTLQKPGETEVVHLYRCDRCGKVGRMSLFYGKDYCPRCRRVIVDVIGQGGERRGSL